MTRLTHDMVSGIPATLAALDEELSRSTGESLLGLAGRTVGYTAEALREALQQLSAAVVPISSGHGLIPGFTEAVVGILEHLGLRTLSTTGIDIRGFGEAIAAGTDILFAADDVQFLAMRPVVNRVIENRWATAIGCAA